MNGGSLLPYVLVAFVVFLYLPHVFFKIAAEKWIDLGRKRDSTQLEEFISAALPSFGFNALASISLILPRVVLRVSFFLYERLLAALPSRVTAAFGRLWDQTGTWMPGHVDWHVVSGFFSPISSSALLLFYRDPVSAYVARGFWWSELSYLVWLYLIAYINGAAYGRIVAAKMSRGADTAHVRQRMEKLPVIRKLRLIAGGLFYKAWNPFYQEFHVGLFAEVARQAYVIVRTIDDRRYLGLFFRYEKQPDGQIIGLVLRETQWLHASTEGEDIYSQIHDAFYLPWSRIADINFTSQRVVSHLKRSRTQAVQNPS